MEPNVKPVNVHHHPHPVQECQTQYNYLMPMKGFAPRPFIVPQRCCYKTFYTERDDIPP